MTICFIRLDDACPKRDVQKWDQMESLLDKYHIKPLVGVIPNCQDPQMKHYAEDTEFWSHRIPAWQAKGWTLALHGFEHYYFTKEGGINPVNKRSEFAGLPYEEQAYKIRQGYALLKQQGITPQVFFAPAHTFDENTLKALQTETDIRFISDTPANDAYVRRGFTFIPQQAGAVRPLPFMDDATDLRHVIFGNLSLREWLKEWKNAQSFALWYGKDLKHTFVRYMELICKCIWGRNKA